MLRTKFEPDLPGAFEGKATVEVVTNGATPSTTSAVDVGDPSGAAPSMNIETDHDCKVEVTWTIEGLLQQALTTNPNLEWNISVYAEPLGAEAMEEKQIGSTMSVPFNDGTMLNPNMSEYRTTISVPASTFEPGVYRLVTVILAENRVTGSPLEIAAFVEGPVVQFSRPASQEISSDESVDRMHRDQSVADWLLPEANTKGNQIRLFLRSSLEKRRGFTVDLAAKDVLPYLNALIQIQHVIDEFHGRSPADVRILAIRAGSVSVDLTGGIRDTVELILDLVVPWRRENKKRLADLAVSEKAVELKQKEAEFEQTKVAVQTATDRVNAETETAIAEAALRRAEAREKQLTNQKTELEIMSLAIEMFNRIAPGATEEQRLLYMNRMFPATRLIAISPLEIVSVTPATDDLTEEE